MKRSLQAGWALLLLITSYGAVAQTAEDFNERITNSTDSFALMAAIWVHAYQDAHEGTAEYAALKPLRKDLQQYIKQEIRNYKQSTDVDGSEGVRSALLAWYQFEADFVENSFTPFENLKPTSPEEEVTACRNRFTAEVGKEKGFLEALNKERKAFAQKNSINLAPPPDAPKAAYTRPAQPRKEKEMKRREGVQQDSKPVTKKIISSSAPAPVSTAPPPPAPREPEQARPMSSGNPNNKLPPKEDPKTSKEKDKDEDESDD